MKHEFTLFLDGEAYNIVADGNSILVDGQPFVVGFDDTDKVLVDGLPRDVTLDTQTMKAVVDGIALDVRIEGLDQERKTGANQTQKAAGQGAVMAIMPGKIIRVLVAPGEPVAGASPHCPNPGREHCLARSIFAGSSPD